MATALGYLLGDVVHTYIPFRWFNTTERFTLFFVLVGLTGMLVAAIVVFVRTGALILIFCIASVLVFITMGLWSLKVAARQRNKHFS